MAISWSIVQLDYAVSLDGETDVVNNSHWQCIDEDASGNQARVYGSVAIPTDDIIDFIPYADITEAKALEWTKAALGDEEVASMEANVAAQLALLEDPVEGSGTPWAA
tara:strand:+ start:1687 stop:2010 length:324 start_codon:yes stop_codon:yes gene_type:complete